MNYKYSFAKLLDDLDMDSINNDAQYLRGVADTMPSSTRMNLIVESLERLAVYSYLLRDLAEKADKKSPSS